MRRLLKNQRGTTLVEMTVTTFVFGILVVGITGFIDGGLSNYSQTSTQINLQSDNQRTIRTLSKIVHQASQIETVNRYADQNPGNPFWTSDTNHLVLLIPSTDSGGNVLFTDSTHFSPCTHEAVVFLNGPNLYLRTIKNPSPSSSCSTDSTINTGTCSGCQPDTILQQNVFSPGFSYFDAYLAASRAVGVTLTSQQATTGGAIRKQVSTATLNLGSGIVGAEQ